MSQKRCYPTALALYITYFVLGISSSVMGHYKQEFAALWGAVPGADGMYDIPSVVAVIAAIGLGRRRSRPILNRNAVSTRSTQPSRYNRHSKSPEIPHQCGTSGDHSLPLIIHPMVRVGAAHVEGAECVTVLQSPDYYRLHRVHAEVLYIVLENDGRFHAAAAGLDVGDNDVRLRRLPRRPRTHSSQNTCNPCQ